MTRVPVVLGLGRRSGAGTVASALHATECRRPPLVTCGPGSWYADIAVCAGDEAALGSADAVRGAAVLLVVRPGALIWFPPTTWSPATSDGPIRPAPPIGHAAAHLRIRALHRPAMGPARVGSARAG